MFQQCFSPIPAILHHTGPLESSLSVTGISQLTNLILAWEYSEYHGWFRVLKNPWNSRKVLVFWECVEKLNTAILESRDSLYTRRDLWKKQKRILIFKIPYWLSLPAHYSSTFLFTQNQKTWTNASSRIAVLRINIIHRLFFLSCNMFLTN